MNKTGISILQILYYGQQQLNVIQDNKDSTGGENDDWIKKAKNFC
jgi:hypothetical protein